MVGVLSLDLDGLKMYGAGLKMYAGGLKMYRCPNFVKTKIIKKVCAVSSHITAKPYIIYKRENITFRELLIK